MALHSERFHIASLCAGVGGLDLGLRIAVPHARTVVYVERESYAAACLVARMEEEALHAAPIWDDLTSFDGYPWRGAVDCLAAGFPCQPWSVAGRQAGTADERWIWDDLVRIIREMEPRYVFLENVRGLVSGGGLWPVLGSLASIGFDAEWLCLRASSVGAAHQRERVFILAHRHNFGQQGDSGPTLPRQEWRGRTREPASSGRNVYAGQLADAASVLGTEHEQQPSEWPNQPSRCGCGLGDSLCSRLEERGSLGRDEGAQLAPPLGTGALADADGSERWADERPRCFPHGEDPHGREADGRTGEPGGKLADAQGGGLPPPWGGTERCLPKPFERGAGLSLFAPGPRDPRWPAILAEWPDLAPASQPAFCDVAHGDASRLGDSGTRSDQLRCLGNGVVPVQAAVAFVVLMRRMGIDIPLPDGI